MDDLVTARVIQRLGHETLRRVLHQRRNAVLAVTAIVDRDSPERLQAPCRVSGHQRKNVGTVFVRLIGCPHGHLPVLSKQPRIVSDRIEIRLTGPNGFVPGPPVSGSSRHLVSRSSRQEATVILLWYLVIFLLGIPRGGQLNRGIYGLPWRRRDISPWSRPPCRRAILRSRLSGPSSLPAPKKNGPESLPARRHPYHPPFATFSAQHPRTRRQTIGRQLLPHWTGTCTVLGTIRHTSTCTSFWTCRGTHTVTVRVTSSACVS